MLTLYHYWDSTCSFKVRLALEEKGLAHEKVFLDLLKFDQLQPDYLKLNPSGVVPTLVHGAVVVNESTVINEYLEDAFPERPLLPRDPAARARVRYWVKAEETKLHPATRIATFNLLIKPLLGRMTDAELEERISLHPQKWVGDLWRKARTQPRDEVATDGALDDLRALCARLDDAIAADGPFIVGPDLTLADCAFVSMIDRMEQLGQRDFFSPFKHLSNWVERMVERPSYAAARPPEDKKMYAPLEAA